MMKTGQESYKDQDVLERLYHGQELSASEIADRFSVGETTIFRWMDRHGIPRRSQSEARRVRWTKMDQDERRQQVMAAHEASRNQYAGYRTSSHGYEEWGIQEDGASVVVRVHQLLAISLGEDPYDVFSGGKYHVHHKNGIPWDNRPENIELKTHAQHIRHHCKIDPSESDKPWHDGRVLRELYHDNGMSTIEIADRLGCSKSTVLNWMRRHGIKRRAGR